jgi:hypothetical protein
LYDEHEATFEQDGLKVRVVGIPYHGSSYNMERFTSIEKGDEDILICVAHVLASLKGGSMFEGEDIIKYIDLLDTAPDVYLFGHWHMDQGIETLEAFPTEPGNASVKHFVNVGSLTRGALSQDELKRKPATVVIRCLKDGVEFDIRRLEISPPEEVFDLDGRARQVKRQVEMDAFVSRIRDSLLPVEGGATIQESVELLEDLPLDVRERALAYLEKV